MKRNEIKAGDVLLFNESPKWDELGHYQFGGEAVVVLSEERYYTRPADAWRYSFSTLDEKPSLDPSGKGVLVARFIDTIEGTVQVGEQVVSTTSLRGDWHELTDWPCCASSSAPCWVTPRRSRSRPRASVG